MLTDAWKYLTNSESSSECSALSQYRLCLFFFDDSLSKLSKVICSGNKHNSSKSFFQGPKNCCRRQRIFLSRTELELDFFDSYFISKTGSYIKKALFSKWGSDWKMKNDVLFSKTKTMHFLQSIELYKLIYQHLLSDSKVFVQTVFLRLVDYSVRGSDWSHIGKERTLTNWFSLWLLKNQQVFCGKSFAP